MFHAEMIEEYSENFNLSKADTVAEILRAYPKLIAYKHRIMDKERIHSVGSFSAQTRAEHPLS